MPGEEGDKVEELLKQAPRVAGVNRNAYGVTPKEKNTYTEKKALGREIRERDDA